MAARTVFVISPIGSPGSVEHRRYKLTLEYIVKKAFAGDDWAVVRADEESSPDSITTQVIGRIVEADIIVADLSDHNPNVFYELAVAHGYQKPVVHLMEDGQKVPFDVVDQRVIFYDLTDPESVDKARLALAKSVEWLDENSGQSRNPLSSYGQFSAISSASGGGEAGEAVASALQRLTRQVTRLELQMRMERSRGSIDLDDYETVQRKYIARKKARLRELQMAGEEVADEMEALRVQEMKLEDYLDRSRRHGNDSDN